MGPLLPLLYTAQLSPGLQTTYTYQNLLEPSTNADTSNSMCLDLASTTVVHIVIPPQATPGVRVVVLICPHFQSPEVSCPVPVLIASGLVASPLCLPGPAPAHLSLPLLPPSIAWVPSVRRCDGSKKTCPPPGLQDREARAGVEVVSPRCVTL